MHDNRNGTNCDAIISAFHTAITDCNQMWVIDDGSNGSGAQCPPQLLLFDLNTDQLIHRYRFNTSTYIPRASQLFNLVVNVRDPPGSGKCENTMIYIADVNHHGLVVYDFKRNDTWRFENLYMYPDPKHGHQSVAGDSFILMDGIFGIATDKQNLYFHPLASVTEYAVPLKVLDENNKDNTLSAFRVLGERKSACTASAMDSNNNLYCVTLNPIELIKWNVNTPYDRRHIETLPIKSEEMQFISGMKVARNHNGTEELWMVSSRYQKMRAGTRNFNEVNFRVVVYELEPSN